VSELFDLAVSKRLSAPIRLVPKVLAYGADGDMREALEFLSFLLSLIKEDAYQHKSTVFVQDSDDEDSINPHSPPIQLLRESADQEKQNENSDPNSIANADHLDGDDESEDVVKMKPHIDMSFSP
jgi:hypothetical protein